MSTGYSLRVRNTNAKASIKNIGVRLGRACIKHDIPVAVVAKHMGVSRATVYNWFCGTSVPQDSTTGLIEHYLSSLK